MNPLDPMVLVLGLIVTAIMFVAAAFFTRATSRRIVGAFIGVCLLVLVIQFYDAIAAQLGWWHYPSVTTGNAPLAWYIAAALGYGGAFGLVGWRVIRRFSLRGLVGFLVAFALFGVTRDYLYSITTELIVFGPGLVPLGADLFAYASGAALVQLLMYWIVGSPRSDPLARMSRGRVPPNS